MRAADWVALTFKIFKNSPDGDDQLSHSQFNKKLVIFTSLLFDM